MALEYRKPSQNDSFFTPKAATELIKEVAVLELEVLNLEQYLLSLYRKAFDLQASVYDPEPLLYFALCFGNHSDPAIRVYTPQSRYLELETAKEEYILAKIRFRNDQKVILPKNIQSFNKDSGLNQATMMEMIQDCLPEHMRKTIKNLNIGKSRKSIVEWIPHNFGFRYLIAKELIQ